MGKSLKQNLLIFPVVALLLTTSCYKKSRPAGDIQESDSRVTVVKTDAKEPTKEKDCCVDTARKDAKPSDANVVVAMVDGARNNRSDAIFDAPLDAISKNETDVGLDAAKDALISNCDWFQCPDPSIPGEATYSGASSCCTSDGECGWTGTFLRGPCKPFVKGWPDPTCLDVEIEGEIIQGCCRPDGYCGHTHEELGCHELFNEMWAIRRCGQLPTDSSPPNPFKCLVDDEPCSYDWECCTHYNYGTSCNNGYCALFP